MITQPDFAFLKDTNRPSEIADLVVKLIEYLRGKEWVKASRIGAELGLSDRQIRQIASESEGRILSGQQGYKLTMESNPEEVQRSAGFLKSQARKMLARALQIERIWHRFGQEKR